MAARPSRPDVLVVEDDLTIREQLAEAFEGEGLVVRTAANGREALEMLTGTKPAIIVLDLMMPMMSGWDLVGTMRAMPGFADVKVVIITATSDRSRAPVGPVFAKPIDLDALIRTVKDHIGLAQ
jgi:CheY-like chemotaxis protein